jgi:hypothetical protein
MTRTIVALLTIAMLPVTLAGGEGGQAEWQNIRQLSAGQKIEVIKKDGKSLKGAFVASSDDSIRLQGKRQEVAVPRAEVLRVRTNPDRGRRNTWIGAAIGAGGGLAVGAGLSERLSDFPNLKPAAYGLCAGVGALVGALIGSVAGGKHSTIYSAK